ncbi:MAG TPA: hypothetical protein VJG32_06665 [Anaerolineae bacterium]|nr:hypothetical protein [Anaerolineae bacterium]
MAIHFATVRNLKRIPVLLILLVGLAVGTQSAAANPTLAAPGDEHWADDFDLNGANGNVYATLVDGDGNLYIGGDFTTAGSVPVNRIARWNGSSWSALGAGVSHPVRALALGGDGSLYAGGDFTTAGGVSASRIAKWDGSSWSALGTGMNGAVNALVMDGSGNVYAGGDFTTAGGVSANRIAKWDGSSWSALGGGMSGGVNALAVDGSGNLYAGGSFAAAGSLSVNRIAKWDGANWSALGSGTTDTVFALAIDSGDSQSIYAGGDFASAGGVSIKRIARWNGSAWSALGAGANAGVRALALDANGNLYAGGNFTLSGDMSLNRIATWNGSSWSALGSGINAWVRTLALDASGNVYAGGEFTLAGDKVSGHIARYDAGSPLSFNPASARVAVGSHTTIALNLGDVADFYGYQFRVNYDASRVSASGAFVNSFFDTTTNTNRPPAWDAQCAGSACQFGATKLNPATPVSGSGTLAQITFTGLAPGVVPLTFSDSIVSDRDGNRLAHSVQGGTITVYGFATITGSVSLQGRATPIDSGSVTFTDQSSVFPPTVVSFDPATGNFSANVPVEPGGTTYNVLAAHSLYLGNQQTGLALTIGDSYDAGLTELRGGDANADSSIELGDMTCIGGAFGGAPTICGTSGSSDINADGATNILDLVLPGGNYGLSTPQPWQ